MNDDLHASDDCLNIIKESESFFPNAYRDPGGIPTIAWGHTDGVKMGDTCTREQGAAFLISDVSYAERIVKDSVKVPLSQNQFDALVSFAFNVGPGKAGQKSGFVVLQSGNPSTLLRLINAGDFKGAALQFGRWITQNGRELPGLVTRRAREAALFAGNGITAAA